MKAGALGRRLCVLSAAYTRASNVDVRHSVAIAARRAQMSIDELAEHRLCRSSASNQADRLLAAYRRAQRILARAEVRS